MRLIDADAIVFTHAIARSIDDGHNWNELCVTKDEIDDMPSAEPERKTGKWTHDGSQWENRWICSECGYKWFFRKEEAHFCPNCGAEMTR